MTTKAIAYLNEALDYIQENSIMKAHIDWQKLRQESLALVAQAQTATETYPAKINWTQLSIADDPVLQAATQWLLAEEGHA